MDNSRKACGNTGIKCGCFWIKNFAEYLTDKGFLNIIEMMFSQAISAKIKNLPIYDRYLVQEKEVPEL